MKLGKRKCKNCGEEFQKERPLQSVCCFNCAAELLLTKQKKDNAQAWKVKKARLKESLKTLGEYKKDLQIIFNKFIRLRDAKEPCISCQRHHKGQYHAGHYKPAGINSALKFSELNVHKQCAPCNNNLSGNLTEYRINLIIKIGIDAVIELENNKRITSYDCEQLKEIEVEYKNKLQEGKL